MSCKLAPGTANDALTAWTTSHERHVAARHAVVGLAVACRAVVGYANASRAVSAAKGYDSAACKAGSGN